mgnify:CR=1 FL=1
MMIFIYNIILLFSKIIVVQLLFQQISGHKIKHRWFFLLPLIYGGLFLIAPPIAYFSYFIFPVIYSIYTNRFHHHNKLLDIFYGLYPLVIESLFKRLLAFYILPLFHISVMNHLNSNITNIILELMIFPSYIVIIKAIGINFDTLQKGFKKGFKNIFLWFVDISMVIYLILIQIYTLLGNKIVNSSVYKEQINNAYIILFFMMLLYLNATIKEKLEDEIAQQKNNQLSNLSIYNQKVEQLYNEIRHFKHDYINILTSLKLSIDQKDLEAIKQIFDSVLKDSGTTFSDSKFEIAKFTNISNNAVKSVLSAKFMEAQSKGINISVEIEENISDFKIDTLDFITILSILCDNAIEACSELKESNMSIALIKLDTLLILSIENSTKQETVDIHSIFQNGQSSKGNGRGIGLYTVKTLLDNYPNTLIVTKSVDYHFSQTIEFR